LSAGGAVIKKEDDDDDDDDDGVAIAQPSVEYIFFGVDYCLLLALYLLLFCLLPCFFRLYLLLIPFLEFQVLHFRLSNSNSNSN
jgi:hypothetical protein